MSEEEGHGGPAAAQVKSPDLIGPLRLAMIARLRRLKGPIVAVAAVGAVLSGLVGYWTTYRTVRDAGVPPAAPASAASTEAPAMSVAVLPFTTTGGAAADGAVAVTLTQNLASALARSARYALVTSYGSVAKYAGQASDARTIGRELNVRYLVEGDVGPQGDRFDVGIRFVDAQTARVLYSDRVNATTSAVAGLLANKIKAALFDAETRRASAQSGATADATVQWLRGFAVQDDTPDKLREAIRHFDEALRLDPKLSSALSSRAAAAWGLLQFDPQADRERLVRDMEQFSQRAVAADRNDTRAWRMRSLALAYQFRWTESMEALDEAARIDPYRADVPSSRALVLIYTGRSGEAFAELDRAVRLDADAAGQAMRVECRAHLLLGQYGDAIQLCERSSALQEHWLTHLTLTAAYAQTGQMDKALAAKARLLKVQPGYTIARFRSLGISDHAVFWQQAETHLLAGLRKAGIPDQ
jgi:TolB-like protein/Tfp pilus assembly protein PilF